MFDKTRRLGADVLKLVRPYWRSEERWASGGLLAVIVAMNLGMVYLNVLFNEWNNLFYNALQDRDFPTFTHQFIRFGMLAAAFLVLAVYRIYLRQMLQIRWRRWLTRHYLERWMQGRAYYRLQVIEGGSTDNPDQRIADDIGAFVGQTLILGLGLLESVVNLVSFAGILWGLSGDLEVGGIVIPGYMLWVAVVYAALGTWLTHVIGRPLVSLNFFQQQAEADFRFSLVRLRENAEGVALYGGERQEMAGFLDRFSHVVANWWAIMRSQKRLTWFTAGYSQIAIVFPFIVAAPRYFSGAIQLGGLMQTASAFGQVQGSLSWFVDAYTQLAELRATVDRLTGFERALREAGSFEPASPLGDGPAAEATDGLAIAGLSVVLPDGRRLVEGLSLTVSPGERLLVAGPSGSGKSTLFRAIAGLWPFKSGTIALPPGARPLFLPQKPYIPIASLKAAVTYPAAPEDFAKAEIEAALAACGLAGLASRLDEVGHWSQRLSGGEQQRLAFARALLLKPDYLFLDEASSALDEAAEDTLYRLIDERLPASAIISIAHRPALARFHGRRLTLENGAARLEEATAPPPHPRLA